MPSTNQGIAPPEDAPLFLFAGALRRPRVAVLAIDPIPLNGPDYRRAILSERLAKHRRGSLSQAEIRRKRKRPA
jgi:hypothetical protein